MEDPSRQEAVHMPRRDSGKHVEPYRVGDRHPERAESRDREPHARSDGERAYLQAPAACLGTPRLEGLTTNSGGRSAESSMHQQFRIERREAILHGGLLEGASNRRSMHIDRSRGQAL
jgi:hypothetical protein